MPYTCFFLTKSLILHVYQICYFCYHPCKILFMSFSMTSLFHACFQILLPLTSFVLTFWSKKLTLIAYNNCIVSVFYEYVLNITLVLNSLKQIKILKIILFSHDVLEQLTFWKYYFTINVLFSKTNTLLWSKTENIIITLKYSF